MAVSDVVTLNITLRDSAPTVQGFGRPAILAYHTHWPELSRLYKDPAAMLTDGFTATDQAYLDAQVICSQRPRPKDFKILRAGNPSVQIVVYTPIPRGPSSAFVVGDVYSGTIAGLAWTYTVPSSPTLDMVCDGIAAAMTTAAAAVIDSAASTPSGASGTTIVVTGNSGVLTQQTYTANLTVEITSTDPGVAADLAAVWAVDKDWAALLLTDDSPAAVAAAAAWIETNRRQLFFCTPSQLAKGTTTGVFHTLKGLAYASTAGAWYPMVGGVLMAAIVGQRLTAQPGSDTWAHKTVVGVAPTDPTYLSDTEQANIWANNASTYTDIGGSGRFLFGKTAGGSRIDTIRYINFLYARLIEAVLGLFQGTEKVPYTDPGVTQCKSTVLTVLNGHTKAPYNALATDPKPHVEAPLVADVPIADRANRNLPDVTFGATLTGAIETIEISGTVSV